MADVEVDVLVVGGGLGGLSAAIFLGDLGVNALLVERHASTSHLPKAHYINQRTMEIFRRFGVADAVYAKSAPRENLGKIPWFTSFGGDGPYDGIKFGEAESLGGGALEPIYDAKGSTHATNISQLYLEPILARIAEERVPGRLRFKHELISFEQDEDGVTAVVRDLERGVDRQVRARYLLAADGGKTVGAALGISMIGSRLPVDFVAVWVTADLSEYVPDDTSIMRYMFHPSRPDMMGALLTQGPERWDRYSEEWTVNFSRDSSLPALDEETALAESRTFLGIGDDVEMKIHRISQWTIEVVLADAFSRGRAFLIGDAAHKHTPGAGLGANSAIQDAHNISWKLALVLRGLAPESLLGSYETERRPVVTRNAEWSGFTMPMYLVYLTAAGMQMGGSAEQNEAALAQLMSDTPVGEARRAVVREVMKLHGVEVAAHDMEMGFTYDRGGVVDDGSPPAWRDPLGMDYRPTSRPGARLPHAWLDVQGTRQSTQDIVPLDGFLLLTDPSGQDWAEAAEQIAEAHGITIDVVRIGEGGEATDPHGAWQQVREIEDGGTLLVRPDGHVGYRAKTAVADAHTALGDAISAILSGGTGIASSAETPQAPGLHQLASALGGRRDVENAR